MIGQTITHYKITDKLGEGGMGVVYKAEDTTLGRTVALKFLASHLVEDQEGRQRFIHEAKAAAALDHPNICTVYEVNQEQDETFIAIAYVEGQSVKQKIEARPLKLDEALDITIQTGQGLKAAHQKAIVHRDIKPANLMLTEEGQVKIMDFGLAHVAAQTKLTKTGASLGTVAYMSPEQAQGEGVDKRSDVWSLGVVLYEMVTGQSPFKGEYAQAVAYNILNEEPEPVTALRAGLPMELEFIVGKALAKDREERYQHVDDMIVDLRGLGKKLATGKSTVLPAQTITAASQAPSERPGLMGTPRVPWAVAAVATMFALAVVLLYFRQPPPEAPLRKFALTPPSPLLLSAFNTDVAVSPDGRYIAFKPRGGKGLGIQGLEQPQPRLFEGTQGANNPFWSPGSDFIGFVAPPELKKVSIHGGAPIRICEMPRPPRNWGASWSPDGEWIVFAAGDPPVLYEVSASGGTPNLLVSPEESEGSPGGPTGEIWRPHFLPSRAGPRVLVFAFGNRTALTMMVQDLETGRRETLGPGALPFYSPSGHIVYQPGGLTYDLLARPFSLDTLEFTGSLSGSLGAAATQQLRPTEHWFTWTPRPQGHGNSFGSTGGARRLNRSVSPRTKADTSRYPRTGGAWRLRVRQEDRTRGTCGFTISTAGGALAYTTTQTSCNTLMPPFPRRHGRQAESGWRSPLRAIERAALNLASCCGGPMAAASHRCCRRPTLRVCVTGLGMGSISSMSC